MTSKIMHVIEFLLEWLCKITPPQKKLYNKTSLKKHFLGTYTYDLGITLAMREA
jgi:hypothetical protein